MLLIKCCWWLVVWFACVCASAVCFVITDKPAVCILLSITKRYITKIPPRAAAMDRTPTASADSRALAWFCCGGHRGRRSLRRRYCCRCNLRWHWHNICCCCCCCYHPPEVATPPPPESPSPVGWPLWSFPAPGGTRPVLSSPGGAPRWCCWHRPVRSARTRSSCRTVCSPPTPTRGTLKIGAVWVENLMLLFASFNKQLLEKLCSSCAIL